MTIETYLEDLADYLHANSLGVKGVDLFANDFDSVTNCISLTPFTGSTPAHRIITKQLDPYNPFLSVLVRDQDDATAFSKITAIYKLLMIVSNQMIGTTKFLRIKDQAPPEFVEKTMAGENWVYVYSVNFSLLIQ